MKKFLSIKILSLFMLVATPAIFADFGDVLFPTAVGAGIGGAVGGGRGAGIGAAVGFGAGALSSAARDRRYYNDYNGYNGNYTYSRPVGYRGYRTYRQPVSYYQDEYTGYGPEIIYND